MKCQMCGRDVENFYILDSDGVEKKITYCDVCKRRVLSEALKVSKKGLNLMAAHVDLVQDSIISSKVKSSGGRYEIFVKMPVVVLSVLFEEDEKGEERNVRELYLREMSLLQRKLERAIEAEDYREASRLKRRIQQIKKVLETK